MLVLPILLRNVIFYETWKSELQRERERQKEISYLCVYYQMVTTARGELTQNQDPEASSKFSMQV